MQKSNIDLHSESSSLTLGNRTMIQPTIRLVTEKDLFHFINLIISRLPYEYHMFLNEYFNNSQSIFGTAMGKKSFSAVFQLKLARLKT